MKTFLISKLLNSSDNRQWLRWNHMYSRSLADHIRADFFTNSALRFGNPFASLRLLSCTPIANSNCTVWICLSAGIVVHAERWKMMCLYSSLSPSEKFCLARINIREFQKFSHQSRFTQICWYPLAWCFSSYEYELTSIFGRSWCL